VIISLLTGILVFLMFVQGGQSLIFSLPADEARETLLVNTLGRKWEFTFTTLVTFGGTFFASFPLFYSTSFGGAYWLWISILSSFIVQAVAYEFRSKPANLLGKKTFDVFLYINGSAAPFLIGIAIGTFFTGSPFSLDSMNRVSWISPWHGLEALGDSRNISLGLSLLFLTRLNGAMYLINSVEDESIYSGAIRRMALFSVSFLAFFLFFLITLLLAPGYSVNSETGDVTPERFKYLHNLLQMPVVSLMLLSGIIAALRGIWITLAGGSRYGIWFTGPGTIIVVACLLLIAGFNNTPFYPSVHDPRVSLTIANASSGFFTLKTMMYVSFFIPAVAGYIWYAWRAMNRDRLSAREMEKEEHKY
jgi:cytochrome d ubiquinol oxidase subunit II